MQTEPLVLEYTPIQEKIFLQSTAKYVVASCGRRSGKTHGASLYCIDLCLNTDAKQDILWCDVQYNQILGYFERYFLPTLRKLDPTLWDWNVSRRELKLLNSTISFRSADRPDLLVGRGYSLVVLNEAGISLHESPTLWTQIILPMLLDYTDSRAFLIGTPRGTVDKDGKESLYYTMFKRGQEEGGKYQSFKYSSYDNPFLKAEDIKELEEEIAPQLRLQELYGEFLNLSELQVFNPDWWQITEEGPRLPEISTKFISIDTAFGTKSVNDESAATVWLKTYTDKYYCIDCWHDRVDYPTLVNKMKDLAKKHSPNYLLIENKASGQSLVQTLKLDLTIPIHSFEPNSEKISDNYDTDKISRAVSITNIIEAGKVYLLKASWNDTLINQCTIFPIGNNDDIVDTISMALIHSRKSEFKINQLVSRKITSTPIKGYGNSESLIKNFYNNEE